MGTHGLQGRLKVLHSGGSLSTNPKNLTVYIKYKTSYLPFQLLSSSNKKNIALIQLETLDSIEKSEIYIESELMIQKKDLPKIKDKNETYELDWVGLHPLDGENLIQDYTVIGFIENPAHPILVLKGNQGEEILIPFVDRYIGKMIPEKKAFEVFEWTAWLETL